MTHSTRASIARGCRRWRPSLPLFPCVCVRAFVRPSFLVISFFLYSLSYRDYLSAGVSHPSYSREIGLARVGRVRQTSTPPDEPPYFSSGWFTFSGAI